MNSPYQLKPDPFSSHRQIAGWLAASAAQHRLNVLDVGCSEGFIGALLPEARFHFTGVDHNPQALAKLPPIYRQRIQADVETLNAPLPLEQPPDVLVLADVLEHTRSPEACLGRLLPNLGRGGEVILSLPNVAHLYVRLSLLLGRWEYADRGILDRTHVRFFTLRSGLRLCQSCGIRVTRLQATPLPLPLVHAGFAPGRPLFPLHALSAWLSAVFKPLLAYQMIFFGAYGG